MRAILHISLFLISILRLQPADAQAGLPSYPAAGTIYTQNFDSLPASGSFSLTGKGPFSLSGSPFNGNNLAGWQVWMPAGTGTSAVFAPGTGSATGNGLYSLGTAGSSERALGSLSSGSGVYAFGVIITNTTGMALNNCTISFAIEQWRRGGSGNRNTWSFRYKTGSFSSIDQIGLYNEPSLDIFSITTTGPGGSLNGNLPENRQQVSFTLRHLNWKNGEQLLLRWDDADEAGSDDICAIDDFSFSASQTIAAPVAVSLPASSIGSAAATLNGTVDDQFANTAVVFEYDTSASFTTTQTITANPANIPQGSGITPITAEISGLSATNYYFRIKAANTLGTVYSNTLQLIMTHPLPIIRSVSIPDKRMKAGDTVTVSIAVNPDTAVYKLQSGKINNLPLSGLVKKNDSLYTCLFIISANASNIADTASIPVSLVLTDAAGNSNTPYQIPIVQLSDAIDVIKPFIAAIKLPADSLYKSGDTLGFVLRFNEKISVTNLAAASGFSATIGSRTKLVNYLTGSGTDSLLFRYIIQPGDIDNDGIRINSPLPLVNMEIRDLAGNTATLTYNFPSTKNILADGVAPTITSVNTPTAAVYKTGNLLDFVVNFSKKIWVNDALPQLGLLIGNTTRYAVYNSGSGSTSLSFRYVIAEDDMDKDGIKLISPFTTATTILDAAGNVATLTLSNIGALSSVLINPPTISATRLSVPANNTYRLGDILEFALLFNEKAFVDTKNGIPSVRLTIGSTARQAFYTEGSGSNTLLFQYTIQKNELDSDGISIGTNIALNNGVIKDEKGNPVPLTLNNMENTNGVLVDAADPFVKNVTTPAKGMYATGDTLNFIVSFSENVFIRQADSIFIEIIFDYARRKALYISGDGSSSYLFRYIITAGDLDKNGIKLDSFIITNNGLLSDQAGNKLVPALLNIGALSLIRIDGVAPVFAEMKSILRVCENAGDVAISSLLSVNDTEEDETLSWQLFNTGKGIVSKQTLTGNSNGKTATPSSIYYHPSPDTNGSDSMIVQVSDGVHLSQKIIQVIIQPAITNNQTGAAQLICAGNIPNIIPGSFPGGGDGNYMYQWETASTNEGSSFSKAAGINNQPYYAPGKLSAGTWFRRKVFSGGCQDIALPTQILVVKNGLWTGNYDSYWNNPNNWCTNSIPDQATDVLINAGTTYQPEITDSAALNQLQLSPGATLGITGLMKLKSGIQNNSGIIDATKGTIILNGMNTQTIPGGIFTNNTIKNLLINNTAGVSLSGPLNITGDIVLNSGALITNNQLLLQQGASIGPSATGTAIKGEIIMEKAILSSIKTWQLLGHPFNNSIPVPVLRNNNIVSGFNSAGIADPLKIDSAWLHLPKPNDTIVNIWQEFTGIRIKVTDTTRLLFTGNPHTGNQEINFPYTGQRSFHLLGNPYPAPVDLSRLTRSAGIGNHYWLWNPLQGLQGGYTSIPFNTPYIINPFDAFIVRSDGNTGSLLFTENSKAGSYTKDSLPFLHTDAGRFIELRIASDSIFWDRILLIHSDSSGSYYDSYDAEKLWNADLNFYSISRDKQLLSIDTRPLNNTSVIPLGINTKIQQRFSIKVASLNVPSDNTLQLHDKWLEKWTRLEKDSSYYFGITTDTSSSGEQRFEIASYRPRTDTGVLPKLITRIMPVPAHESTRISYSAPEKAHTMIRLLTLTGIPLKQVDLGIQQNGQYRLSLAGISPGIYLIELRCGEQTALQKLIKD